MNSNKPLTMKELPLSERPYEKLETLGASQLTDAELLAIILKSGACGEKVTDLAKRLLAYAEQEQDSGQPLSDLLRMSSDRLYRFRGLGRVKVIQLKALLEISARIAASQARERFCAANPESVAALYMQQMRFLSKVVVKAVFLNGRNEIITAQDISLGTVNFSIISARDIFLAALKQEAVSLIMLHNHPSGDPRPSRSDIIATKRLRECGTLLEIQLWDHIIIGNGKYFSMREEGSIT